MKTPLTLAQAFSKPSYNRNSNADYDELFCHVTSKPFGCRRPVHILWVKSVMKHRLWRLFNFISGNKFTLQVDEAINAMAVTHTTRPCTLRFRPNLYLLSTHLKHSNHKYTCYICRNILHNLTVTRLLARMQRRTLRQRGYHVL